MSAKKQAQETKTDFTDQEIAELIEAFLSIEGPNEKMFAQLYRLIQFYFRPTVVGLENIPDEPTLFIGNHAMFGLDGLILMPTVYAETGRFLRAMGDKAWFQTPTGMKMADGGMVLGNPQVCSALMENGHDLLVFPGGAGEANKTAGEKYTLKWRERYGFVRMAAQHGYNITPFGTVGPDDWWDHAMEGEELLNSKLVKLLQKRGIVGDIRPDLVPPIPRGLFNTLLPKPEPCYLAFGEPIEVPDCTGKAVSKRIQSSVREATAASIEGLVADMLLMRSQDKQNQGFMRRLLTR
ncbi:lysophospholipid acyltransferase family protein [Pseudohalioglobus lutimaris]|uniref:Acyltransferase n=1 Tax=Pseudohalioglobus lutimaris TaxID=1737061 RepID=A0A2N5X7V6_9GAMM|nr:lysophospholipid acyltransferase family protein [Pseudohalioglobus lutimaris]PLW70569.1 acyltransferase [Pseudohalioglobus lutimaris]